MYLWKYAQHYLATRATCVRGAFPLQRHENADAAWCDARRAIRCSCDERHAIFMCIGARCRRACWRCSWTNVPRERYRGKHADIGWDFKVYLLKGMISLLCLPSPPFSLTLTLSLSLSLSLGTIRLAMNHGPPSRCFPLTRCESLFGLPLASSTVFEGTPRITKHRLSAHFVFLFLRSKEIRITQSLSEQGTFSLSDEESPRTRRWQSTTIDEDNDDDRRDWWWKGEHRGICAELSASPTLLSSCQKRRWIMNIRISRRPCPATARTRSDIHCQNITLWFPIAS